MIVTKIKLQSNLNAENTTVDLYLMAKENKQQTDTQI